MNSTDKKQIQLHKMELDEKYLSRKLPEISQNKTFIIGSIQKYKSKCKCKNKGKALIHQKTLVKISRINKRIMRLLIEKDMISHIDIFELNLYTVADVEEFLKNNNSIHKHG